MQSFFTLFCDAHPTGVGVLTNPVLRCILMCGLSAESRSRSLRRQRDSDRQAQDMITCRGARLQSRPAPAVVWAVPTPVNACSTNDTLLLDGVSLAESLLMVRRGEYDRESEFKDQANRDSWRRAGGTDGSHDSRSSGFSR